MTREARALRAVKSHPAERRSAGRDSSSGGGAVVVRVQLIRDMKYVVFHPNPQECTTGERRARGPERSSAAHFTSRRSSVVLSFCVFRHDFRGGNLSLAGAVEHSRARSDANDASRTRCRRDATMVPGTTWRRLSPSRAPSSSWRCTRSPSPTRCVRRTNPPRARPAPPLALDVADAHRRFRSARRRSRRVRLATR